MVSHLPSFTEVFVFAFGRKRVVTLNALFECGGIGNAQLRGKLIKGVGFKRRDLIFVHALLLAAFLGHIRLQRIGVEQLARPLLGLRLAILPQQRGPYNGGQGYVPGGV